MGVTSRAINKSTGKIFAKLETIAPKIEEGDILKGIEIKGTPGALDVKTWR